MPTHAENRQNRRKKLMDAARSLYAESGVENTTMEEIARKAQCTRRTIYAYFESWEDLMFQVFAENLARRWSHQEKIIAEGSDGLDRIRRWALSYFAFARENPEAIHLEMFRDYRGIGPSDNDEVPHKLHEEKIEPLMSRMITVFEEGQVDGTIRPDLVGLVTLSQFSFSLRAIMNRVLSSDDALVDFDPEEFVSTYVNLFLRGIAGPRTNP